MNESLWLIPNFKIIIDASLFLCSKIMCWLIHSDQLNIYSSAPAPWRPPKHFSVNDLKLECYKRLTLTCPDKGKYLMIIISLFLIRLKKFESLKKYFTVVYWFKRIFHLVKTVFLVL